MFLIRLTRIVPLIGILLLIALVIYFVALFRFPNAKAKHIVIQFFTWICTILTVAFLVVTLYGLVDGNLFAVELFGSFLAAVLIGLIATLLVKWRFLKKFPQYKYRAQDAKVQTWWRKLYGMIFK